MLVVFVVFHFVLLDFTLTNITKLKYSCPSKGFHKLVNAVHKFGHIVIKQVSIQTQ